MRAFHLLTISMVVLFATAFAGSTEQRSLRVSGDDNSEERVLPSMESLNAKYQVAKSIVQRGYQGSKSMTQAAYQAVKAKAKEFEMEVNMLGSIKKGEKEETILANVGVKPLSTNAQGRNVYDANEPWVQRYNYWHGVVHNNKR